MPESNGKSPTHTSPAYPPKSAADRAAFEKASYVRAEPLSQKGADALARLETALAPLPTETASRRRVMNVRGW